MSTEALFNQKVIYKLSLVDFHMLQLDQGMNVSFNMGPSFHIISLLPPSHSYYFTSTFFFFANSHFHDFI